jgi:hypothetical protein
MNKVSVRVWGQDGFSKAVVLAFGLFIYAALPVVAPAQTRTVIGFDGASNHWVGPTPDADLALGIHRNATNHYTFFFRGPLTLEGNRTILTGFDGAGMHWIGPTPDTDLALGIRRNAANAYSFTFNGDIATKHGVVGESPNFGVTGRSTKATGFGAGLMGQAYQPGGFGVYGVGGSIGIYGTTSEPGGYAARFIGNVEVQGTLSKSAGSFKIDHPLDPANKYLSHSFVESPDMLNIYNGIVVLNDHGEAVVGLPNWFGALNKDVRYQLTAIGKPAPNLHVAHELADNRFTVGGGSPGMKVSWQVTGVRQDAFAKANPITVEQEKPEGERGSYLHPLLFNQPEEKSLESIRHPEVMRRLKEDKRRLTEPAQ